MEKQEAPLTNVKKIYREELTMFNYFWSNGTISSVRLFMFHKDVPKCFGIVINHGKVQQQKMICQYILIFLQLLFLPSLNFAVFPSGKRWPLLGRGVLITWQANLAQTHYPTFILSESCCVNHWICSFTAEKTECSWQINRWVSRESEV